MNKAVCYVCVGSHEDGAYSFGWGHLPGGVTDAWLVVVAVELEFRTQVTSKCQSAVVDQLIVPLIWSLGRLLESPFGKSVENLTM